MNRSWLGLWLTLTAACAGSAPPRGARPAVFSEAPEARREMLAAIGQRLYARLRAGEPESILLDALELGDLVDAASAGHIAALRARGSDVAPPRELVAGFANTRYAGVCLDRARPAAPAGEIGLLAPAFVFDRALIMASDTGGGRVAAWLEGTFVVTDDGVWALLLQRVETPRREHADLDLQQCDLADLVD